MKAEITKFIEKKDEIPKSTRKESRDTKVNLKRKTTLKSSEKETRDIFPNQRTKKEDEIPKSLNCKKTKSQNQQEKTGDASISTGKKKEREETSESRVF